jgi:hypothetical protein
MSLIVDALWQNHGDLKMVRQKTEGLKYQSFTTAIFKHLKGPKS